MVIKGWDEGISRMSLGQTCEIVCAPEYAYGHEHHAGEFSGKTLHFEVELHDIK